MNAGFCFVVVDRVFLEIIHSLKDLNRFKPLLSIENQQLVDMSADLPATVE